MNGDIVNIIWACETCGRAIRGKGGYATISYVDIARHDEGYAAWKARAKHQLAVTFDQLLEIPPKARWRFYHDTCRPDGADHEYSIDIDKLATHRCVLKWTAHLMEKNWFRSTDWGRVISHALTA